MAEKYMFVAGSDACGACAGLDGTISKAPLGPQHDYCQCQDVPVDEDGDGDCPKIEITSVHIETGSQTTVGAEVTVRCCDGTEVGQSVEQNLGPVSLPIEQILEGFEDFVEAAANEVAGDNCAEGVGVDVEDGDLEGLA